MILTTADLPASTDAPVIARSPRALLLAGLRAGRYPSVPAPLTAAFDALESVDALMRQPAHPVAGLGPFTKALTEHLLAGATIPDDFADVAHEAQVADDRQSTASVAKEALRRSLTARFPGVVTASLDGLFDGLRAQLDEVLGELRSTVGQLGSLDVADPDAVAGATDDQRVALLALGELRKRYGALRMAQRQALEASDLAPPGTTAWTVDHGWPTVYATGADEFEDVRRYGLPGPHTKPVDRLRGLASRPDVWLPAVDELQDAWDRLHERRPAPAGSAA